MARSRRLALFAAAALGALAAVGGVLATTSAEPESISTVAGTGGRGLSGDGGQATAAQLDSPRGVAVDATGNLYIADLWNHRIRKVTPEGVITTVAGTGTRGFSGDGGPAIAAQLDVPQGIAVDAAGNLFIADSGNRRVRKVSPQGVITTVAGADLVLLTDGGPATSALFLEPADVAVDTAGNFYIADSQDNRVHRVNPQGIITTVAGTGTAGFGGDGGPATAALLFAPRGVDVDSAGNVYIADARNNRVRRVSPQGVITTVAGTGTAGFSGDGGPATAAELDTPHGVTVSPDGGIFVADTANDRVRYVSMLGTITTVAGTGTAGFSGDGGAATAAELDSPRSVAVDAEGGFYIADLSNHRIRHVQGSGGAPEYCTIVGTSGPDRLVGTGRADVICGLGGNDEIRGLGGNDIVLGGAGNDVVYGGRGHDRLAGGTGSDFLYGQGGHDRLAGGSGDDSLLGGSGLDELIGGDGRDTLLGNAGDDLLRARDGAADQVDGGGGLDEADVDELLDRYVNVELFGVWLSAP